MSHNAAIARRLGITPPLVAAGLVLFWSILIGTFFGGHDALTYLAAGERLNAGHPLYALSPGDRIVETIPPFYGPLLSPPLIAVLFRPIAAIGVPAMWVWTILLALVILVTTVMLVQTWRAVLLSIILSIGLGWAAISGNVADLFLPAFVLLWRSRDRPIVGALLGFMGALKLLPFVFVGFLVAGRRYHSLAWCAAGAAVGLIITLVGAGTENTIAYLAVARDSVPQASSLPYLTGIRWLSPVLLVAGTLGAAILPERSAFRLCVFTFVFGGPVLAAREFASLIVMLAPSAAAYRFPAGCCPRWTRAHSQRSSPSMRVENSLAIGEHH
jgi:hypothetical protein